ncbi:phosphoglucosamine mutase [Desulfurobacterium atlanticum]|uniref:Phosphoglucosamine mutase n=1 Tax=Desulfurobacterium atlanticum TaxID=240169 RepID=A0A238Y6Q1_9BACT|nr:phosphoglucosamine mutase [Desulfurobacterium atlanticum]SNR66690.1 phosphoglucosamine mutase [Desulfurobacterium atlanticum]
MPKKKLFGTDGIRAIANEFPLTPEMSQKIGISAGCYLKAKYPETKHTVVIGKDTRLSSDMIVTALISGLLSTGVDVVYLGTTTTPSISYMVKNHSLSMGIMVSASHNPPEYNGIKFFNNLGKKFSDMEEASLELVIFNKYELPKAASLEIGQVFDGRGYLETYIKFLEESGVYLAGLRIAIDCANGAAFMIAPEVFRSLGAKVFVYNAEPDGFNINDNCGATYPEFISKKVQEIRADIGFAFDGDADRCIAVDENGNVVDGDQIIALLSDFYGNGKPVVATVMSNLGLENYIKSKGVDFYRTSVGDRNVAEKMDEVGALIGGEQSGHIIYKKEMETGDGVLTAVLLASILKKSGKPFSELVSLFKKYPQKLVNLRVSEKKPIESLKYVKEAISRGNEILENNGRVLVRYSGTEPKVRIMVEAENEELIEKVINIIAEAFEKEGIVEK